MSKKDVVGADQTPAPEKHVAVETLRALETANAQKHMIEAACKVINDRGKGNNVTIADVAFMIDAAIRSDAPPKHPDDIAVDRFAAAMKAKLAKKRDEGRGGWEDKDQCPNSFLSELLLEHVAKGDPVDVGNLAMMLHQRGECICVPTERVAAISQLHAIVDAWEALPGGRQVKNSDVERWLAKRMGPGIDAIRDFLRRPRPDSVLPPVPALATTEGSTDA